MWVRNGLQIKGQAMTYIQCHFCNSMVDADMFLLQLCATRLDPSVFLKDVLERFHVLPWLSLSNEREASERRLLDQEQEIPIMESALIFLASLITLRTNLGLSEQDLTRSVKSLLIQDFFYIFHSSLVPFYHDGSLLELFLYSNGACIIYLNLNHLS